MNALSRVKRMVRAVDVAAGKALRLVRRPAVLFEVSRGFGFDAQAPVIARLLARGRVRPRVVAVGIDPQELTEQLQRAGIDARVAVTKRAASRQRFALTVVTDEPRIWNWRRPPVAYLHHGSSFANRPTLYALQFLREGMVQCLYCLAQGEVEYCVAQLGDGVRDRLIVTGQPKIDALVNGGFDRRSYLEQLGLDPGLPTVLLVSHWSPQSLVRSCDLEPLSGALRQRDVNLIVTAHHLLFNQERVDWSGGIDWTGRLKQLFTGPRMRVLVRVVDNRPMLAASDVMIGDHSSIHLEYATLQRPMILYHAPGFASSAPAMTRLLAATAMLVDGVEQIPARLDAALADSTIDRDARARLLEQALAYVGSSAQRVAEVVESQVR